MKQVTNQAQLPGVPPGPRTFAEWARDLFKKTYWQQVDAGNGTVTYKEPANGEQKPEWETVVATFQSHGVPTDLIPFNDLVRQWTRDNLLKALRNLGSGWVQIKTIPIGSDKPIKQIANQLTLPWEDARARTKSMVLDGLYREESAQAYLANWIDAHPAEYHDLIVELMAIRSEIANEKAALAVTEGAGAA